jgi:hypothetical protein
MLIDYLITPADKVQRGTFPAIKKVGDTFIGEMEHVEIRGKPMFLWGKGTAVHDAKGELIAAIQAITVGEQQVSSGSLGQETYIGGISSLTVKVWGVLLPGRSVPQPVDTVSMQQISGCS